MLEKIVYTFRLVWPTSSSSIEMRLRQLDAAFLWSYTVGASRHTRTVLIVRSRLTMRVGRAVAPRA